MTILFANHVDKERIICGFFSELRTSRLFVHVCGHLMMPMDVF